MNYIDAASIPLPERSFNYEGVKYIVRRHLDGHCTFKIEFGTEWRETRPYITAQDIGPEFRRLLQRAVEDCKLTFGEVL